MRINSGAGSKTASVPHLFRENAAQIAVRITQCLIDNRPDIALRHFIQLNDNLVAEHGADRYALGETEPALTGAAHWDAAIAGLVCHHLAAEGLHSPAWTDSPDRFLSVPWTFNGGMYISPVDAEEVPFEFLRRGVFIGPETLESV